MTAELGHASLIVALCLAVAQMVTPMVGSYAGYKSWMRLGHSLALGQFVLMAVSFACLTNAFLQDDFSLAYVANNSNSLLPVQFKVSAVWGAHEGSLLLWALILAGWSAAVALFSRELPLVLSSRVLSVLGGISVGFALFLLLTSNPFERILPVSPVEGGDLNPLLQDFGLIVHPPMLYMGYVGFSVPFAFAIAALLGGQFDSAWSRWVRPWINTAWVFLTIGITLGSWWAYYELGWGGWWFWDAVENASFMPWLVGTALIHSLAASEKRGVFKSWTVLLAISTFSLSLLGAFLVRSGVLTSVHAFAVDPTRGVFILVFLILVIGGSLALYAWKASGIRSDAQFEWTSREAMVLINNLLLVVATASVLLGTLYPLLYEVMTDGKKISVGPPYFNRVFVPIVCLLFVAMAVSPFSRWRRTSGDILIRQHWPFLLATPIVISLVTYVVATGINFITIGVETLAVWILVLLARHWWQAGSISSASQLGMMLAHTGIAVAILGVVVTTTYSEGRDVRMNPGDSIDLAGYEFIFEGVQKVRGPNYLADQATFNVTRDGEFVANLRPEKRVYSVGQNVMTEADMDPGLLRDVYVALGENVGENAWAVRIHVKPFVRWIWLGGLLVAVGGLVTLLDKRYRRIREVAGRPLVGTAA